MGQTYDKSQYPGFLKKLYVLLLFANEFLQVLFTDAPITALQSAGLLSEDSQGSISDSLGEKADFVVHRAYETMAIAITVSIVSRAAVAWQGRYSSCYQSLVVNSGKDSPESSFARDMALDSLVFSFRAMSSGAAASRTFMASGLPFKGYCNSISLPERWIIQGLPG